MRCLLLPVVVAPLLLAPPARAASCCGTGPSAVEKLGSGEAASFTLSLQGLHTTGGWDASGAWGGGTGGSEVRAELAAAVALGARVQLGLSAPAQYAWRQVDTIAGEGGGLGDLALSGRFDPMPSGLTQVWPSVGLTLALSTPTGRAEPDAKEPLAADATGLGGFELRPGVALDGDVGPLTYALSGSVGLRQETDGYGRALQRAPGVALFGFAGRWFGRWLVGASASTAWEGATSIDGRAVPGAERRRTTAALLGAFEIDAAWSIAAEARSELPIGGLGQNEPGGVGGRMSLRWALLHEGG